MTTERASDTTLEKPLSDKHRRILKTVEDDLVRDMAPEEVLRKMAASEVLFTHYEEEKIKGKPTRAGKCEELLEILSRKSEKAYQIFKKVLRDRHPPLENIILECENTKLGRDENSGQADRARQAPHSTRNENLRTEVVTLQQCMSIEEEAGNCWKKLGSALQIPESKLRNIKTDHPSAIDRGYAVLQSWRDKEGSAATVGCLSDVFESIGQKKIAEKLLAKQ